MFPIVRAADADQVRAPLAIANVIQRQVAGDSRDPGAAPGRFSLRHRRARDTEKDLLREVPRGVGVSDDPPQIAEHAVPMFGEEYFGVGHVFGVR